MNGNGNLQYLRVVGRYLYQARALHVTPYDRTKQHHRPRFLSSLSHTKIHHVHITSQHDQRAASFPRSCQFDGLSTSSTPLTKVDCREHGNKNDEKKKTNQSDGQNEMIYNEESHPLTPVQMYASISLRYPS